MKFLIVGLFLLLSSSGSFAVKEVNTFQVLEETEIARTLPYSAQEAAMRDIIANSGLGEFNTLFPLFTQCDALSGMKRNELLEMYNRITNGAVEG